MKQKKREILSNLGLQCLFMPHTGPDREFARWGGGGGGEGGWGLEGAPTSAPIIESVYVSRQHIKCMSKVNIKAIE